MSHEAPDATDSAVGDEEVVDPETASPDVQWACVSAASTPALARGIAHTASHHARPVEAAETTSTSMKATA